MSRQRIVTLPSKIGEPVWELAELYPFQGHWSAAEYLALDSNKLIEFSNGSIELLPMPSQSHQFIVLYLYQLLFAYVSKRQAGVVLTAPLRVRISAKSFREPDIVFSLAENDQRRHEKYWDGADLVMEVVSPDNPNRDLVQKRREYAAAGIPEYWIIDPLSETITVLKLEEDTYAAAAICKRGVQAHSVLLNNFQIDVAAVFDAPQ